MGAIRSRPVARHERRTIDVKQDLGGPLLVVRPPPQLIDDLGVRLLRGEQLGRRTAIDFGFVGDTQATLRALLPHLQQNDDGKHLTAALEHYRKSRKDLDDLATGAPGKTPIEVEMGLEKIVPAQYKLHAHHWLILHGRYVCIARKPRCYNCLIADICLFTPKTVAASL